MWPYDNSGSPMGGSPFMAAQQMPFNLAALGAIPPIGGNPLGMGGDPSQQTLSALMSQQPSMQLPYNARGQAQGGGGGGGSPLGMGGNLLSSLGGMGGGPSGLFNPGAGSLLGGGNGGGLPGSSLFGMFGGPGALGSGAGVGASGGGGMLTGGAFEPGFMGAGGDILGGALGGGGAGAGGAADIGGGLLGGGAAAGAGAAGGEAAGAGAASSMADMAPLAIAAWVVCSELNRQKLMDDNLYAASGEFAVTLPHRMMDGYHLWAKPMARYMKRSPLACAMIRPLAIWRAKEILYRTGKSNNPCIPGKVVRWIGEPICYGLGYIIEKLDGLRRVCVE